MYLHRDVYKRQVTELVDFSTLMDGYYGAMTHPVPLTGSSFWQAGEDDWLHLNSVQYLSLIHISRHASMPCWTSRWGLRGRTGR